MSKYFVNNIISNTNINMLNRIHMGEIYAGMYLLICAIINMRLRNDHFFIYLYMQSAAFFIVGFGYVGITPN